MKAAISSLLIVSLLLLTGCADLQTGGWFRNTFSTAAQGDASDQELEETAKILRTRLQSLAAENVTLKRKINDLEENIAIARRTDASLSIDKYNQIHGGAIYNSFPSGEHYFLKVGDFKDGADARMLSLKLKENALSVWAPTPMLIREDPTYEIYVGYYRHYADALRQGDILVNNGLVKDYRIVAGFH